MRRRPPWILWFHTLGSLWRLLLLTTGVLVTVLAFAASIKPVASGELPAGEAARFIVLALLPMSAYALPFACAFASTLTYHRLATDLELTAAQASGLSLRLLLVPAAATGLVVAGALAVLNERVIPGYLRGMQRVVKADLARVMTAQIQRGRSVEYNDVLISADSARALEPDPASGASDHVVLLRMVAMRIDREGKIVQEVTASRADLWMFPDDRPGPGETAQPRGEGRTLVVLRLDRAVAGSEGRMLADASGQEWVWAMPSRLNDDPKFLTFGELRELRSDPDRMNWINNRRKTLALAYGSWASAEELRRRLDAEGRATFVDAGGNRIEVRAAGMARVDASRPERWTLIPSTPGAPVEVGLTPGAGGASTRWTARGGAIEPRLTSDAVRRDLAFELELSEAQTFTANAGGAERAAGTQGRVTRGGLTPVPDPMEAVLAMPSPALVSASSERALASPPGTPLRDAYDELTRELGALSREITSKQHERAALAASCFVMVLTGAVTAVRLSRSQPLTVYLWTFFPALLAIMTIAGGQNTTHNAGVIGLPLLWAGVASLLAYTLAVYARLARH